MIYHKLKTILFYSFFFKSIGRGSNIINPLLILNSAYISIGRNVLIRDNARLEVVKIKKNDAPELTIGDNTNIEQNCHIICHHKVLIGSNVSITANCAIVDVTHPYDNVNDKSKIGNRILDDRAVVEIGDNSFIGIGSIVLPHVKIGEYVVIGAHSVVIRDIPSFSIAVGNPARVIKKFNKETNKWEKVAE